MALNERQVVREAAQKAGIEPRILWGVYGTETNFGHDLSTSSAGAEGPFQFEPGTAKSLGINPHDFVQAAHGAARYLAQFKGRGLAGMLSAYNAGPAGGIQQDYVNKVLANARSFGSEGGSGAGSGAGAGELRLSAQEAPGPDPALVSQLEQLLTQQSAPPPVAEQAQLARPAFAPKLPGTGNAPPPLTPAPEADPAAKLLPLLEQLAGSSGESSVKGERVGGNSGPEQALTNAVPHGTKLAGFLSGNAELQVNRLDQGQDIRTNAGGPILAPGNGYVVATKDDPGGFGTNYPIVHFTSGPLAGHSVYIGHTHSALPAGAHFQAGQVLSHTGHGTAAEGNARTPGWAEIGLWGSGGPGNMEAGKQIAPLLGLR